MQNILLIWCCLLLCACAGQQLETNQLANQLYQKKPQYILEKLQSTEPPERDYAQFHLNVGLLQLLSADFPASIKSLSQAKKEMALLSAISISENVAAGSVNETLRSYSGYPTDRVMVHNILALAYLFNNDIEGARVEMLQADVEMKKLATKGSLSGQLASTHLLSGIIYELFDEHSNALISYKHTEKIMKERGLSIPSGLQQGLLRMSYVVDRKGQYKIYKKRYDVMFDPERTTDSQVFTLYFDGIVSNKVENTIVVPSGNDEQLIRISMPAYRPVDYRITNAKLINEKQQLATEMVESLDQLVREDLQKEYPSILLLTTTRAIAKYELVDHAAEADEFLGLLANLATLISEVADLRSWNMLPSNIQFGYLSTSENELTINRVNKIQQTISIPKSSKNIVLISSLDAPVFHYLHQ